MSSWLLAVCPTCCYLDCAVRQRWRVKEGEIKPNTFVKCKYGPKRVPKEQIPPNALSEWHQQAPVMSSGLDSASWLSGGNLGQVIVAYRAPAWDTQKILVSWLSNFKFSRIYFFSPKEIWQRKPKNYFWLLFRLHFLLFNFEPIQ